jgi:large subunit ribosomal protein L18
VIDDIQGKTLCGASTKAVTAKPGEKKCAKKNISHAGLLGDKIAKEAIEKGIKKVDFDRAGYKYHGTVKALADGARKAGLEF